MAAPPSNFYRKIPVYRKFETNRRSIQTDQPFEPRIYLLDSFAANPLPKQRWHT